jgi:membrane protease YdiL (CAAX protease family)
MRQPPSERPVSVLLAVVWTLALWFAEVVCVGVTESVRPGAETDVVNLGACQALATSAVIFAMVRVHARELSLRATLGVRAPAVLPLLLAGAAGAGLYPFASTIDSMVVAHWPYSAEEGAVVDKLLAAPSPAARVALVAVAFLVIPVARELFFRGILFTELRRAASARIAILASTLLFAGYPSDPRELPTSILLGLALGVVREQTGTVVCAVAAHLAYGAVEAIPVLAGRDPTADVTYPMSWIVGGAAITILALSGIALARARKE